MYDVCDENKIKAILIYNKNSKHQLNLSATMESVIN